MVDLIIPVEKYGEIIVYRFLSIRIKLLWWRGGMASNALKQLIADAAWGDLDYFLIDLPPASGDQYIHRPLLVLAMTRL